jgi:hypothetical protein
MAILISPQRSYEACDIADFRWRIKQVRLASGNREETEGKALFKKHEAPEPRPLAALVHQPRPMRQKSLFSPTQAKKSLE